MILTIYRSAEVEQRAMTTLSSVSSNQASPDASAALLETRSVFLYDEAATIAFGYKLAQSTQRRTHATAPAAGLGAETAGGIIHLQGDLGAGKTTLTRGFLRGYGHEGAVKSPTYTLVEPYELAHCNIYHFDLYRLSDPEEFEYLGADQYFESPNLCLVEWAEHGAGWAPSAGLRIELSETDAGRTARCSALSQRGSEMLSALFG